MSRGPRFPSHLASTQAPSALICEDASGGGGQETEERKHSHREQHSGLTPRRKERQISHLCQVYILRNWSGCIVKDNSVNCQYTCDCPGDLGAQSLPPVLLVPPYPTLTRTTHAPPTASCHLMSSAPSCTLAPVQRRCSKSALSQGAGAQL